MEKTQHKILICEGVGCKSPISTKVQQMLEEIIKKKKLAEKLTVSFIGCQGYCSEGPILIVEPEGILYGKVELEDLETIIDSHIIRNQPVESLFYKKLNISQSAEDYKDIPLYTGEKRVVLDSCGHINPEHMKEYLSQSEDVCMVDLARYCISFTEEESCGKCTPCREGIFRALEILGSITSGTSTPSALKELETLSQVIKDSSLCYMGKKAPNPVLTTLAHFREEYEEHITERKCRAGICNELFYYKIIDNYCITCGTCARVCPVNAVVGSKEEGFFINTDLCTRCSTCYQKCPINRKKEDKAIIKVSGQP